MIIGVTDGETYVASDVPAILQYTRNVYYIGNLEFARLTPGEAHFFNLDGDEIEKQTTEIKWDAEAAEKAGFEHFMMKEIHEQPRAVQDLSLIHIYLILRHVNMRTHQKIQYRKLYLQLLLYLCLSILINLEFSIC